MNHGKALAITVAYDIYKEVASGVLDDQCKADVCSFYDFRQKLALQMLHYDPRELKYPGDERMRVCTKQCKAKRAIALSNASVVSSHLSLAGVRTTSNGLSREDFEAQKSRLCGDITPLYDHVKHVQPIANRSSKKCVVCGQDCYFVCMKCKGPDGKYGVAMHKNDSKTGSANNTGVSCFYHHHNKTFFGLAKNDYKLVGSKRKRDYHFPTETEMAKHRKEVNKLLAPTTVIPPMPPLQSHTNPHHVRKLPNGESVAPI